MSSDALLERFHEVDEQIAQTLDPNHILLLKSHRNALAPISRLPDTLLTTIFLTFNPQPIHTRDPESATWIYVTHVCRSWRQAALECALLWINIIFDPPDLARAMLERSRSAPLTVRSPFIRAARGDDNAAGLVDVLCLAMAHISRIRDLELRLNLAPEAVDRIFAILKTKPAMVLEQVTLYSESRVPWYLPDGVFQGITPRLLSLALGHCQNSWHSLVSFRTITSLLLRGIPPHFCPSLPALLSILQQMDTLHVVFLSDVLPQLPPTVKTLLPTLPEAPPITLPHITVFTLEGFALDVANVMRYIILPNAIRLRVHCSHRGPPSELHYSSEPLFYLISSFYDNHAIMQDTEFHRHLVQDASQSIFLEYQNSLSKVSASFLTALPGGHCLDFLVRLQWEEPDPFRDVSSHISNLVSAWPLHVVREFTASSLSSMDAATWEPLLTRMTSVQALSVAGFPAYGFAQAMNTLQLVNADDLPLPDLSRLSVSNAHFSFPMGPAQLTRALQRALTTRASTHHRAIQLTLKDCNVTSDQLAALQGVCEGEIECTGEPQTYGVGEESDSDDSDESGTE